MGFLSKFWPGRVLKWAENVFQGNLYAGRQDEWPGCPEFLVVTEDVNTSDDTYLWAGSGKTCMRGLIIADKGDACDLILRRAGPDNSKYNEQNADIVRSGSVVGTIYWQAWGGTADGRQYWTPRNGHEGRLVTMRVRASGDQTATSRGGRLQIGVTKQGDTDPTDRLEIDHDGTIRMWLGGKMRKLSVSNGFVKAS